MDTPDIKLRDESTSTAYGSDAIARAQQLLKSFPERIGRYRILERIGGGGMGEVYVAEQTEPIKRRVAVKVIRAGMDTRQVVARFEAERQVLAMMDHPNIARVFDAGTDDAGAGATGRPYFVMELVRGIPITLFCDENRLTTRQRVELLVPICQAVQHAHQKGIIHRDIKPHNVLVTLHDGVPVPKVIDFGIAKATSQPLTDKTVYTEFRQMIGTPAYMSPEQAEMSGLDIDTRSDIYSLGVLAYELLTGSPPFENDRLVKAGLAEIQRIIKEEDPPRPSVRLSTIGDRLTPIAKSRDVEPSKLSKLLVGELDWIVMRAMEKDRRRRYDTATDLAADFNRHLHGEPVVAAPPTWRYRTRKFVRKNKGPVAATATVCLALILGLIGTAWELRRARAADLAETVANQRVSEANRRLQETVNFAKESMGKLLTKEAPDVGGMETYIQVKDGKKTSGFGFWAEPANAATGKGITVEPNTMEDPDVTAHGMIAFMSMLAEEQFDAAKTEASNAQTEAYTADLALAQSAMTSGNWPEARARLDACPESKRGWEWNFLRKQAGSVLWSLPSDIESIQLSNDGKRLLSKTVNNEELQLWDAHSGKAMGPAIPCSKFDTGMDGTTELRAISPDCTRVLLLQTSGDAEVWDTQSGKRAITLQGAGDTKRPKFSPDGTKLLTVYAPSEYANWSYTERRGNIDVVVHDNEEAGHFLAQLWDVASGKPLGGPMSHNQTKHDFIGRDVSAIESFARDGEQLLLAKTNDTLEMWNVSNASAPSNIRRYEGPIGTACLSPDNQTVATYDFGHLQPLKGGGFSTHPTLKFWNTASGKIVNLEETQPIVYDHNSGAFNSKGNRFVIPNGGVHWIVLCDVATGAVIKCLDDDFFLTATFSPDSSRLITTSQGYYDSPVNIIRVWGGESGAHEGESILANDSHVVTASFTADSQKIISFSTEVGLGSQQSVALWSLDGAMLGCTQSVKRSPKASTSVVSSPDGKMLYIRRDDLFIAESTQNLDTAIDVFGNTELQDVAMQADIIDNTERLKPFQKGELYQAYHATIAADGSIDVADAKTGTTPRHILLTDGPATAVAASPSGTRLAIGNSAGIRSFDSSTSSELAVFPQEIAVKQLQFTPDGTRLIIQFADGSAQIWDPRPLAERRKMWARRAAERKPAREYIDRLLANTATTQPTELKTLIREDATITPLRKLVALEQLDLALRKRQRETELEAATTLPATTHPTTATRP